MIWTLKEGNIDITDDKEIAEIFNKYFIKKIEDLTDNIHRHSSSKRSQKNSMKM